MMKTIQLESHDQIAVLRLARGVTNAIDMEMVTELTDVLAQIAGRYRGLVLAGGPKFFSIGLDLPMLLPLDRSAMARFLDGFHEVVLGLYTLPVPTVAAISGHATAGGTILALGCDFRLIAEGKSLMGVNEIQIGLPVPFLVDLLLRQIVGDRTATQMTYTGQFLLPDTAAAAGLVDGVFPGETVEQKAMEKIAGIAASPPDAFALIKKSRIAAIEKKYRQYAASSQADFLGCWFHPEVRKLLHQAAEKY